MPLILTPRQLSQRAEVYHQFATLTKAGLGLIAAVDLLREAPTSRSLRKPLGRIRELLDQGTTFTEALIQGHPSWLPAFDLALIEAGEKSGRLDVCFRILADYYAERARLARQILSDLAYPAFMLHLAVLIFPTSLLTRLVWQGQVVEFVLAKLALLVPFYLIIGGGLYVMQASRNERLRSGIEVLLRRVPVLGAARANLALARLSMALESLVNAGVSILEAWPLAAAASGSPALRRVVRSWESDVRAGQTPAEAVKESGAFPDLFSGLYSTGEISGQLDDTLRRLHQHYQEESSRQLQAFARWAPRMVYFGVLLLIAYQVVSFWSGYYAQINELTR
jgi:type II secretory pathway component PulF